MSQTLTLEQARKSRENAIEHNRDQGVIDYASKQPKADVVYEVTEGYKHLPSGRKGEKSIRLGPGNRFRPTLKQVQDGSLKNKARELSRSEYAGISRDDRRPVSTGAEIGLRTLNMEKDALKLGLDAGLEVADFEGVKGAGAFGRITLDQVQEVIGRKGN